jgi:acyl-coenzyme A thioesterase PaaI-like protein
VSVGAGLQASLAMAIGEELRFDEPGNVCFGCSPHNERGLQLHFMHVGPSAVEGTYVAPNHTCGAPGVIHGGIQAVLLDEAIGFAIHAHHMTIEGGPLAERVSVVTAEFDLRYRRPAPVDVELTLRAEVVRVFGRDYLAIAEMAANGDVLTTATARWRRVT